MVPMEKVISEQMNTRGDVPGKKMCIAAAMASCLHACRFISALSVANSDPRVCCRGHRR